MAEKKPYKIESDASFSYADEATSAYYAEIPQDKIKQYNTAESPLARLERYLPQEGKALDIGSGSGRDLAWLLEHGFDAYGAEPSTRMREQSLHSYPDQKGRIFSAALPDLSACGDSYDLAVCNAVLQHLPKSLLFDSFFSIKRLLAQNGTLILSIPLSYPNIDPETDRDKNGRLFAVRPPEEYIFLAERLGLSLGKRIDVEDGLGRSEVSWCTLIFYNRQTDGVRPIEKIESILRSDRKVNSYKFALLRAMGEIAVTAPHSVSWRGDGYVVLSMDHVAEKWLEYYWSLVIRKEKVFQGQQITGKLDITFRRQLAELAFQWEGSKGGLQAFRQAWYQQELDSATRELVKNALARIRAGIRQPVQYAGTEKKVFRQEGRNILIPADLWQEFSLMGRWFEDSILMRWAQFTADLKSNSGNITAAQCLDVLLQGRGETERDVSYARRVYEAAQPLECVWSGITIPSTKRFDVDHAIPYALWHNNDLWNLLPADPRVNNEKRDKLPENKLLTARKSAITANWELMFETYRSRFSLEAGRLIGSRNFTGASEDFNNLFHALTEAVEITALQRAVPRWEPG